jgi:phosphopantothenoylcysteine decarboxylase/phosphopantothenate--cysteine ligase
MNCIVTVGPTYEPVDAVRRLTNFSTGRLGSQLADFLSEQNHQVTLLRSVQALHQNPTKAHRLLHFGTSEELRERLESLSEPSIDAVFHAAAVSDFRIGKIWSRKADGERSEVQLGKIPSQSEGLLAELIPTSKIIRELRHWFPAAWLVGWKYEVDGNQADLVVKAQRQIAENQTDACVINGPAYGRGYGVVTARGGSQHLDDALALFGALAGCLLTRQS